MQGSEPKTPSGRAPDDEARAVVAGPVTDTSAEVETPHAASIARSSPASEKGGDVRKWAFGLGGRAVFAIAGGAAALLGAFLGVPIALRASGSAALPAVSAASLAATIAASETVVDGGVKDRASGADAEALAVRTPVWRITQLSDDSGLRLFEDEVGRRPLLAVLAAAKISSSEAQRVTQSLDAARSIDRLGPGDTLKMAIEKATGRVVAFELASSPSDVWQAREEAESDGGMALETRRLELRSSRVRVGKAVLVGADLRASLAESGLTPVDDVVSMLDDALDGHAELSGIRPGSRLRIVGMEERVEGAFVRWVSLEAVEYFPANASAPAVRVYAIEDPGNDSRKRYVWYDGKGRQPFHGGFRAPIPLARIASRFNPHRMHPVLHVLMPHNGVDFAAPVGAPVYVTAAGIVTSVGKDGPCGNKVEVSHAGGITSIYCHLSRYAAGLHVGQHVEQQQLIAYVGQTGRVTGPHLHFGIKRNGTFVDPMTLRLDGVRTIPRALRDEFDRRRTELDPELDGIPLPPASATGAAPVEVNEPETFYEEP